MRITQGQFSFLPDLTDDEILLVHLNLDRIRWRKIDDLVAKLKAITAARGGNDERIYVRGDKTVDYGTVMRVMGRLSQAGFKKVALVTEVEQGP